MTTKMADEQPAETAPPAAEEQAPAEAPTEETPAEAAPEAEAKATEETEATPPPTEEGAGEAPPVENPAEGGDAAPPPAADAPAEGEAAPEAAPAEEAAPPAEEGESAAQDGEAATGEAAPPAEGGEQQPEGEGEQKPEGEQATVEGEGDQAPAEPGAEGEAADPASGDQPPAEGDETGAAAEAAPAEGEEGEAAATEGEAVEASGEQAVEGAEGGEAAPAEQQEGQDEERDGSPLVVGEQLSREGSPQPGFDTERTMSPPMPGSPGEVHQSSSQLDVTAGENIIREETETEQVPVKKGDGSLREDDEDEMEEEEEEEEEEEVPEFDRDQLIERYHQALAEREQQLQQNYQLQHKLAEHFRKKKSEETRQEVDKNITDSEQRYVKYMAQLDDLRGQDTEERQAYKIQIEEMKEKCQAKQALVEDEQSKFMEFQKQVALNSLNSRSGKPIAPKDIEQYFTVEARKEAEVVNVRLENIKLKNKLKKKEQQLKSKEELAEGLHLIDFEQLKIENQTYNEKIEERNEDLLKLRKKITSTVQVLTHLKEKLQFVHAENQVLKTRLHEVEDEAAKKRDKLTRTKQARDHLRIDNHRLRQNCGLLGNEPLLRDFEERKDESTDLRDKLEQLKMQHAELTLSCNGVRKKIEQARLGRV